MNFLDFKEKYQTKVVEEIKHRVSPIPQVSVCVQTYQHVNYIKECLDGILMQKTSFPFEILLGDDESTDGTREICMEYAENHPEKIRLFLHSRENNISINGNPTGRFNLLYNLYSANGKYIAICEGDDYWTDPLKLQKQVDFLEENQRYGICFHNCSQHNLFDRSKDTIIPHVKRDTGFSIKDYILSNKTATCSMLFRSGLVEPLPQWFCELPFADLGLILTVLKKSNEKGRVLKNNMGVYRIHKGGVHGSFQKNDAGLIKAYQQHLEFNRIISRELLPENNYKKILLKKRMLTYRSLTRIYKKSKKRKLYYKAYFAKNFYKLRTKLTS